MMVGQPQTLVSLSHTFQHTLSRVPGFTALSRKAPQRLHLSAPAMEQLQCIYRQLRKKSIFIRMWRTLNFPTIDKLVRNENAYRNSLQYAIML